MRSFNRRTMIVLIVALSLGVAVIPQRAASPSKGFDVSNLDTTCKPCDDFFQYANGGWLAKNPIPAAYSTWGKFNELAETNRNTLHEILEDSAKNTKAPAGSNEQKVGSFYASCMNEAQIEADGLKPLAPELARIEKVKNLQDLQDEVAHLHGYGINVMFDLSPSPDLKDSTVNIAIAEQNGLGLPDRDYYFTDDEKSKQVRAEYVKHMTTMFTLLGDDASKAAANAKTVMGIETKLAESSWTRVKLRDVQAQNNRRTPEQLKAMTPNLSWTNYFKNISLAVPREVIVAQPDYFQALDKQLTANSIDDWKTYLRWHLINAVASDLSTKFVDESFNFSGRVLQGRKEQLPRWKRCVSYTDAGLGEALGQVYVKKAFTPASKARMQELIKNLMTVLRGNLAGTSWMSEATRQQAVAKLDAFGQKIGYPDKWRDYSGLSVDRGSYVMNDLRASSFERLRNVNKIGKSVDRNEWGMTPPTVNAYNNFFQNEIVFPAGILQPPFFNPEADDAVNYGAIGSVIGHEIIHGFDDIGRQFDKQGNFTDWWTADDLKNYQGRAECVEKQFSSFKVEEGVNVNGKLVLGESIADLGGIALAYAAYQKSLEGKPRPENIDGFTSEQRFFLGYGQVWAEQYRPEAARQQTLTNEHPLSRFRVNGPLSNLPEFAAAFGCKLGEPMVREAAERCKVW